MPKSINQLLKEMREAGKIAATNKGPIGEAVVMNKCHEIRSKLGGLLYESFAYPYQSNRQNVPYLGNIKYDNGQFYSIDEKSDGSTLTDEIDVLYITPYRVFPIEVKAYAAKMKIDSKWMTKNGSPVDKSPLTQSEKHARHLYHAIAPALPSGEPRYIVPFVVFVDKCQIDDGRTPEEMYYMPVCTINNFKRVLLEHNTPLQYNLDLEAIKKQLNRVKSSCRNDFN